MAPPRESLHALSRRLGILDEYIDITGRERRTTSDETRAALLDALGIDASTEDAAARALRTLESRERERLLPPVRIARLSSPLRAAVRLPSGRKALEWSIELRLENGDVLTGEGRLAPRAGRRGIHLPLPGAPGPGYHALRVRVRTAEGEIAADQTLTLVPDRCYTVEEAMGREFGYGIGANLYTLRSDRNWGLGDLSDLDRLVDWAGAQGAAFIGLNPLHATRNQGAEISPYRPISRIYRNPLYLDVTRLPELKDCPGLAAEVQSDALRKSLRDLREPGRIEYGRVLALKTPVLRRLHEVFLRRHRDRPSARGEAYRAYLEREGVALLRFATFLSLEDAFRSRGRAYDDWRSWPSPFQDPESAEVEEFRAGHATEIDFHRFLQFELDRQLGEAARAARRAGMPVGLYTDLAIGSDPNGSEVWSNPGLFLDRVTLGAPPDDYSDTGQDWKIHPVHPLRLTDQGYLFWIRTLRGSFRHSGALRLDHVLGLFRQYWIPNGRLPTEGAYIRPRTQDLLGILALESRRHRSVVVGEDLGTVPAGVSAALARWGILSSRLLYFERDRAGEFKPPGRISRRALVTVNNHDFSPLAGHWRGEDLRLRYEIGQIPNEEALQKAEDAREDWRRALERRLRREGLLPEDGRSVPESALRDAVHRYLAAVPTPLVGVSLEDLAGETRPVNLPAVGPDKFPSWTRRMERRLEDIASDPGVNALLADLRACRKQAATGVPPVRRRKAPARKGPEARGA